MAAASWTFRSSPEDIAQVRDAAVSFAREHGVPGPALDDIRLSISEAVTNAVLHAFRDTEGAGSVTVSVVVTPGGDVEVVVSDDGSGMAPRDDSPGLGLGLALIQRLADHVEIRFPPGGRGTEVWMRFRLAMT